MRMMKRWLALIFAASMTLSDCGSITVFATENVIAVEESVSESSEEGSQTEEVDSEDMVSDEMPDDDEDAVSDEIPDDDELISEDETELPPLHIGQIKEGEELLFPDDSGFVYDVPVSFAMSDSVLLFVNYNMEILEKEEGTFVWSILRGAKGLEEGSTCLVDEEDDWVDFEVVPDSPYFTMTENEDEESAYYKTVELIACNTVELTAQDAADHEDYNYYVRAAYYPGTGEEKSEEFYAAATIPVLIKEDMDIDQTQDDMSDPEEVDTDTVQEDVSDAEEIDTDTAQDEMPDAEETGDDVEQEDEPTEEDGDIDLAPEDADMDNVALSLSEDDDQQDSAEQIIEVILEVPTETPIKMHPGDSVKLTAKTVPEDVPAVILWKSSDKNVAAVDEEGEITAKAEGYAQITAQCGDSSDSVMVEVVQENTDKILNLSNDIWIAGFKEESEEFVYTGQKITQDIRVYHNETLLKEKTDYTLTYKNNVNAAACNSAKAPSVTITMKGQYSGSRTLYYTIKPRNIDENGTMGYEQVVQYAKTLKIPAPTLYYNNKKLTSNKDFVCDYTDYDEDSEYERMPENYTKGDSYEKGKVYEYTVNGKGNFTGSFKMRLAVVWNKTLNLSSATVTLDQKQYEYHGEKLTKADVKITSVKFGKAVLEEKYYEYTVYADGVGTGYIEIYPTDAGSDAGYRGMKKVNIKVVGDRQIRDAETKEAVIADGVIVTDGWRSSITFSQKSVDEDGGIIQAKKGILVYVEASGADDSLEDGTGEKEVVLREGEDYTVKYSNHKKVGTATATFTGKGRYKGTLKLKYQITPNVNEENFKIVWNNVTKGEIAYQKGGAVPDFVLKDQDNNVLKNKTDYTVKLANNKIPGTKMSCTIVGKGNYKGLEKEWSFMVKNGNIGRADISIPDKPYSTKANAWKSQPTIKDVNGKKLVAGTDYDKEYIYQYAGMESGEPPKEDSVVEVTVRGIGCYEGSVTGKYRIYKKNISKLKITIDAQEYTGKEITLTPKESIHAYANTSDQKKKQNELEGCYEILEGSYKNNIKAGTAKVTLRGIGDYGGTRTCSFKIKKKTYLINHVKGISLDKTSLSLSLQGKDDEKRILTATIKSEDATKPLANPTVIWSTSNSNIADIEEREINETTVTAHIILKKAGSVTITATAQDGGKKAKCTVTIVDVPILIEADQPIKMKVDDTYKLRFENDDIQEPDLSGITWSISNSEVVSRKDRVLTANKAGAAVVKLTKGKYVQQCYVLVEGDETKPESYLEFHQKPGSVDDTEDIRNNIYKAYRDEKCDGIYIPAGVYWVDATANDNYGIFLDGRKSGWNVLEERDDFEIRLSPGALILTKANSRSSDFHVITIVGCSNITISGGTIIGERNEHKGKSGESGHGIGLYNCTNTHISDMDISQCWGDGIYLGRMSDTRSPDNVNITITNCNVHNNRRNNLGITSANGVTIDDCQFNYAKGTDPQFGIDIETNTSRACQNIKITNTKFKGNAKASMGIMTKANNIRLEHCELDGAFYNMAGTNVVIRDTTIKGEIVDRTGGIDRK